MKGKKKCVISHRGSTFIHPIHTLTDLIQYIADSAATFADVKSQIGDKFGTADS